MTQVTTLKGNYAKNVAILKENIKRGMTYTQATEGVNGLEKQFINANLYNDDEKLFIDTMRQVIHDNYVTEVKATDLMQSMGVTVTNL